MMKNNHELLGQCMGDAGFRKDLLADPEGTLKRHGYHVDPDVVHAIKRADPATLDALSAKIESGSPGGGSS